MARSTLNSRLQLLSNAVFTALGSDLQPTVESGKHTRYIYDRGGNDSKRKHIALDYRPSKGGQQNLQLIASVIVAIARTQGLKAGWRTAHRDFDSAYLVISFAVDAPWCKTSECAQNLPTDFTSLAGFTASTNGDLQLFGGQGLNMEDTTRVLALVNTEIK